MVKRIDTIPSILDEFADVFTGIGFVEGEHHIQLDESVTPAVHAARRIQLSIMDKVKRELGSMEGYGIIA